MDAGSLPALFRRMFRSTCSDIAMSKIPVICNKVVSKLGVLALVAICLSSSGLLYAQSASLDSEVAITKSEAVKITNIDDWLIGVFAATDSINTIQYNWDAECVYSSTGSYKVEVISQNGGTELTLTSGPNSMRYWIYSFFRRGANFRMQGFTDANFTINNLSGSRQEDCSDEPNAGTNLWFAALVRPADFNPAPPGIYQDLVTLLVSPL